MDAEKFSKWKKMAEQFYGENFWNEIFNNPQSYQSMPEFNQFNHEQDNFPNVDVLMNDFEIVVLVELPGVEKNHIQIGFADNQISVKGSRNPIDTSYQVVQNQIKRGAFEKMIRLPENVERDGVKATFQNGILQVRMKREENKVYSSIHIHDD